MLRVFTAFAGYGTDNFALKRLGIPFQCVGFSEIDRWAIKCFQQNHYLMDWSPDGTGNALIPNYGDITKIIPQDLPDFDLFTGGFPCQAFSNAGKGLGELDPRGTLFHEIIRICEVKQPKYIFLENVKGLLNKKHRPTFDKIVSELERIGYVVHWKVLNTKEHGIPQNRQRVFFVCYRKNLVFLDINPNSFKFPETEELKIFIKDILEPEVDKKYLLKEKQVKRLIESSDLIKRFSSINPEIALPLTSRQYANYKGNFIVGNVNPSGKGMNGEVHGGDVAPSLTTNKGEGLKIGYIANIFALRGRNPENPSDRTVGMETEQRAEFKEDGTSNALSTVQKDNLVSIYQLPRGFNSGGIKDGDVCPTIGKNSFQHNNLLVLNGRQSQDSRIYSSEGISPALRASGDVKVMLEQFIFRRLTPKECFRLQGFVKDEVNLEGISDSQAYKLAGNGQSVNVVAKIFEGMFKCQK